MIVRSQLGFIAHVPGLSGSPREYRLPGGIDRSDRREVPSAVTDDIRRAAGASVRESASDRQATDDALESVGRVIAGHDRDHALSEPIPDSVADRLDQTLAYLSRARDHDAAAPAFEPAAPTAGPRRGLSALSTRGRGLLAAAAAVAAVAIAVPLVAGLFSDDSSSDPGTSVAAPSDPDSPSDSSRSSDSSAPSDSATGDTVTAALIAGSLGRPIEGRFADPAAREQCLVANGVSADTPVLGSREVTLGDTAGTLFVLPSADPALMTALVVGSDCGPGVPALLSRTDIG